MDSVPLKGFAPDLDPRSPGILADCDNIVPSSRGFEPLPGLQQKLAPLSGPCTGAILAQNMSGLSRVVAGTPRNLWIHNGTSWVNANRQSGYQKDASYTRWRFCQYGNYTIAVNGVAEPQLLKINRTTFSDLGGKPPIGTYAETVGYFLFMFAPPGFPNQWWCSGIGDPENWTTDLSSQSANGFLVQTSGEIVGARALGDVIIVYKRHSTYIGQYVGPPFVWSFKAISNEAGALSNEAVVAIADAHVILGDEQFYVINGGGPPQKVETPLTNWLFTNELDLLYKDKVVGWWDRSRDAVIWHYPSVNASPRGSLDRWIAWNMQSNNWTRGEMDVECVTHVQTALNLSLKYDEFGTVLAHWDDTNSLGYEDPLLVGPRETTRGIFLNDHALYTLTGTPASSYLVTSDMGDPVDFTLVRRIKPLFSRFPSKPVAVQLSLKDNLGASSRNGDWSVMNRETGWVNLRQSARLHRMKMTFDGDYEIMGFGYDAVPQGNR